MKKQILSLRATTYMFIGVSIVLLAVAIKVIFFPSTATQMLINEADIDYEKKYEINLDGRIGLGVFTPSPLDENFKSVIEFEDIIEKKLEYMLLFKSWGDQDSAFPVEYFPYLRKLELTPVITWEPWIRDFNHPEAIQKEYTLTRIAEGYHDDYVESWAGGAKEEGIEIIIRFAHEMSTVEGEKTWYPWQGEPEEYIKAYKRIVNIFRENEAWNVKFMWSPIIFHGAGDINLYYPGNDYVDLIGFTSINLGEISGKKGEDYNWLGCDYIITEQYKQVVKFSKPIIVTELLSNDLGGDKASWYSNCLTIAASLQKVVGLISVQIDSDFRWSQYEIDWRVDSTQETLDAFKKGIKNKSYK